MVFNGAEPGNVAVQGAPVSRKAEAGEPVDECIFVKVMSEFSCVNLKLLGSVSAIVEFAGNEFAVGGENINIVLGVGVFTFNEIYKKNRTGIGLLYLVIE